LLGIEKVKKKRETVCVYIENKIGEGGIKGKRGISAEGREGESWEMR
jgi:hypothetical protein